MPDSIDPSICCELERIIGAQECYEVKDSDEEVNLMPYEDHRKNAGATDSHDPNVEDIYLEDDGPPPCRQSW